MEQDLNKIIGNRIHIIRKSLKLTQREFSLRIRRDRSTIAKIESGEIELVPATRQAICNEFKVNEEWILTEKGDMFTSTPANKSEYITSEDVNNNFLLKEESGGYPEGQKNKTSEAIKLCIYVMESGTSYADALFHNLVHFDRAVKSELAQKQYQLDLQTVNNKYLELEKSLSEMRTRMDEVIAENKKLRDEKKILLGLNGDSAPTTLTVDQVAPTGTEDKET
ncbi:MAG: helix-turn-helix transcriptional regulator [Smithella sp.]|jgi:transcriptional regulator with XRE-family HTH domain